MAEPVRYNWPVADEKAIIDNVELGPGIRTFVFNGNLSPGYGQPIIFDGICRQLSLTSADDLSGIQFTIEGVSSSGNNQYPIIETIAGPNANTVYTVNNFTSVLTISVDIDMTGPVDVGTGLVGSTNWFTYANTYEYPALALQAIVVTDVIKYTFEATLDSVTTLQPEDVTVFTPIVAMTAATTDQFAFFGTPVSYCRFRILADSDEDGTFVGTILQQGGGLL